MKYCLSSAKDRRDRILFPICTLALFGFTFCFGYQCVSQLGNVILGEFSPGAFVLPTVYLVGTAALGWVTYFAGICSCVQIFRKYCVDERGIHICDLFGKSSIVPWSIVSEIGICKVHYSNRDYNKPPETVLRVVIGPEENGPAKGPGAWASNEYDLQHLKTIVLIRYSEDTFQELQEFCPSIIRDYRHLSRGY